MSKSLNIFVLATLFLGTSFALLAEQITPINNYPKVDPSGASIFREYKKITNPWLGPYVQYLWSFDTTELFWDDGTPEAYYVVSPIPAPNDRMAVRFKTDGPYPIKVIGGRFYSSNYLRFQSFSVCPDAGDYPDVFHPIDKVDSVSGGNPGWGNVEFHGAVFDSNDIWAVIHWTPGYAVGIGADSSDPDGTSYWSVDRNGRTWNQWTATDWMMRLSVASVTDSHDVTAVTMLEPPSRFLPGDTLHPTAIFGNCGLSSETFLVTFDIKDSLGNLIYSSHQNITLASSEIETVAFVPEWVGVNEGIYTFKAYTSLDPDADPANDTVQMQGLCSREIIISYCGDYTNAGMGIVGTWASNRKFMVRMTPPVGPPFYIRRAQIFLNDANYPLEYVCVCPDDGTGLPDTTTILVIDSSVAVPQRRTWATVSFREVEVTDSIDLWVIAKWPEGVTQPHIGFENSDPSSERSWRYYFRNGTGHWENMGLPPYYHEWYFRLIIAVPPLIGIEAPGSEKHIPFELKCMPNSFKDMTLIRYRLPKTSDVRIAVYNLIGEKVKILVNERQQAGIQTLIWDGRDDFGNVVSNGVYFLRFQTENHNSTRRLLKIR